MIPSSVMTTHDGDAVFGKNVEVDGKVVLNGSEDLVDKEGNPLITGGGSGVGHKIRLSNSTSSTRYVRYFNGEEEQTISIGSDAIVELENVVWFTSANVYFQLTNDNLFVVKSDTYYIYGQNDVLPSYSQGYPLGYCEFETYEM